MEELNGHSDKSPEEHGGEGGKEPVVEEKAVAERPAFEEGTDPFDEAASFRALKKAWQDFVRLLPATAIAKHQLGSEGDLERLRKTLAAMPPVEHIAEKLRDLNERTQAFITLAEKKRIESFTALLSAYIRQKQEAGTPLRETAKGWRIGRVELVKRPVEGKARFLYNEEPLTPWTTIRSVEDFDRLEKKALDLLSPYEAWPDDVTLADWFWEAFEAARQEKETRSGDVASIPILDFYRAFRLQLVRMELLEKGPSAPLRRSELPKYGFLFYLDRYVAIAADLPPERRLALQTGSQREVAQGKGLIIGGRSPYEEYRVMCHVVARSAGS